MEVSQIFDKLIFSGEVFTERDFHVGERVMKSNEPVTEPIDTEEIRIRNDFCTWWTGKRERACDSSLVARMADVSLVLDSGDF